MKKRAATRKPKTLPTRGKAGSRVEEIVARVMNRPEAVDEIFADLNAAQACVKYPAANALRIVSEIFPGMVYPKFERLVELLDSEKSVFKWTAILIIGNIAGVDSENRIEGILPRYFAPIQGPALITAANIIGSAHKFVAARPRLADFVARELLKVEQACYKTRECRNVALGQAIESLDKFFEHVSERTPVIEMVRRQLKNTRTSTRKKAEEFLRRHDPPGPDKQPARAGRVKGRC